MKLEQQVTSLELSKKLKELGVKQESLFYWSIPNPQKAENEKEKLILGNDCSVRLCYRWEDWGALFETVSAFTVSELGEMLSIEESADDQAKTLIHLIENKLITL